MKLSKSLVLLGLGLGAFFEAVADPCENDAAWRFRNSKGHQKPCAWVARRPSKRCRKAGTNGVKTVTACQVACSTCNCIGDCCDSATWTKVGQPKKDCGFVGRLPGRRCKKRDAAGARASDECPASCNTCPPPPPTAQPSAPPTDTEDPTANPTAAPTEPADPLAPLSDEFDGDTLSEWESLYPDRVASAAVSGGAFRIVPSDPVGVSGSNTNVWYDNWHGSGFVKEVPAATNFVVETRVHVGVGADAPNGDWNVGGLLARSLDEADNWVVTNIGYQGYGSRMSTNDNQLSRTLGVEAKTTTNAHSLFRYSDPITGGGNVTTLLRLCRVGSDFLMLYSTAGETWTAQNPLPLWAPWNGVDGDPTVRGDMDKALEVGVMTNQMFDSPGNDGLSIEARFDYVRFWSVASLADCSAP